MVASPAVAVAGQGWCVYMLRCRDGSLYTGITNDVPRRLAAHAAGKGAAYTRSRCPVSLVYREAAKDRGAALRREAVNSGAPYCQCSPGAAPGRHCPACGRLARPGIHQGTLPDDEEQQYREEQRDAS